MGKRIIITSGPTNERIDAVMKITNMSTGALGCRVAETMLTDRYEDIDKLYYISPKLAYKPRHPFDDGKVELIQVESTDDLLAALERLLTNTDEHIDAVVHSAAVGDYKGKYAIRAEDIVEEIMDLWRLTGTLSYGDLMKVFENPRAVQNDATKISSYEPHLMTMLELTPKVIGSIKKLSPDTMLVGFKLLEGVSRGELFEVASNLRRKNGADYIVANDLSKIGGGRHWAMIVGEDARGKDCIVDECESKDEIAASICAKIFGHKTTRNGD